MLVFFYFTFFVRMPFCFHEFPLISYPIGIGSTDEVGLFPEMLDIISDCVDLLKASPRKGDTSPRVWSRAVQAVLACTNFFTAIVDHGYTERQSEVCLRATNVLVDVCDTYGSLKRVPTLLLAAIGSSFRACIQSKAASNTTWFSDPVIAELNEKLLRNFGVNYAVLDACRVFYTRVSASKGRSPLGQDEAYIFNSYMSAERLSTLEHVFVPLLRDTVGQQRMAALEIICSFAQPHWLTVDEAQSLIEEEQITFSHTKTKKLKRDQNFQDDLEADESKNDILDGTTKTSEETLLKEIRNDGATDDPHLDKTSDTKAEQSVCIEVSKEVLDGPCDIMYHLKTAESLPIDTHNHRYELNAYIMFNVFTSEEIYYYYY